MITTMLNDYGTTRNEIIELMEKLASLASRLLPNRSLDSFRDSEERLRNNKFNLVVLGEFKRGKSTFINSLLGRDILPTAVVPLTSVVTILRYGESEEAVVVFQDGQTKKIQLEELSTYVTESKNAKNWRGVLKVEVLYPSPLLRDGVQIIDTPGVGSVYEHNTRVAHEFLPNADAAIFIVAADPPISEAEREFLRTIKKFVPKVFFVQNKADRLTEDELQESLSFNKQVIEEEFGDDSITIFPIAAKLALEGRLQGDEWAVQESGITRLERVLSDFLLKERGAIALLSSLNASIKIASELRLGIDLEMRAIQTPLEELQRKLDLFDQRMAAIHRQKQQDLYLVRELLSKLVTQQLDDDLAKLRAEQRPCLYEQLASVCARSAAQRAKGMLDDINEFMPALVEDVLSNWQAQEAQKISDLLGKELQPYTEKVNNLIDQTMAICEDIFEVRLEHLSPGQNLGGLSRFFVHSWNIQVAFDIAVLPLLYLLPARWVRKPIQRAAWKRLWEEFDIHCGQARYDLYQRLETSIREYTKTLEAKIDDTVQTIQSAVRKAIDEKAKGQTFVEARTQELNAKRHEIEEILARLVAIRAPLGVNNRPETCLADEQVDEIQKGHAILEG